VSDRWLSVVVFKSTLLTWFPAWYGPFLELAPGINLRHSPGHTPGLAIMQVNLAESGTFIFTTESVPHISSIPSFTLKLTLENPQSIPRQRELRKRRTAGLVGQRSRRLVYQPPDDQRSRKGKAEFDSDLTTWGLHANRVSSGRTQRLCLAIVRRRSGSTRSRRTRTPRCSIRLASLPSLLTAARLK
jgi:hypothetical protein